MHYLLPPIGKEHQVSFKAPHHDQINRDSDGLFRVENNSLADLMVRQYHFRPASAEVIASTATVEVNLGSSSDDEDDDEVENGEDRMNEGLEEDDESEESEDDESEEDFESMSDDELKEWLTEKDVGFPKSAKRPQLLKLAQEEAERLAEAEEEEEDE